MDENIYQRKYLRYSLGVEARCVVGNNAQIKKCVVTTISHGGAAMNFQTKEDLKPGQNVMLAVDLPGRKNTINFIVKLKWVEAIQDSAQFNCSGGGVIVFIKPDDRQDLLGHAFAKLIEKEKNK